jgi:uncharacterized protein (DUF433 family)
MNAKVAWTGQGAYPLGEAARLSHMPTRTVRRWLGGYDYRHKGELRRSEPVTYLAKTDQTAHLDGAVPQRRDEVLDFEQLLTLLLVSAFNRGGLGLPNINKAAAKARQLYGTENPFVSKHFRSDGNRVFIELAPASRGRERHMIDLLSDQHQFREIVEPSLFKDVVFVGNRAGEWRPLGLGRTVSVNPRVQFGAPHIAGTGVRTDVVAQMHNAEGGDESAMVAVQDWFGLSPEQVADAIEFEGKWLATLPT